MSRQLSKLSAKESVFFIKKGLANSEEYSLMKEEKEEVSPKKEKKKVVKTDARNRV
jgi:hypothetical protein